MHLWGAMFFMIRLRTRYTKMEAIFKERTEALAADAAADEQVALDSWFINSSQINTDIEESQAKIIMGSEYQIKRV